MKGEIEITVKTTDEVGNFPISDTIIIKRDSTPEGVEEMMCYFRKILLVMGYHPDTVKEYLGED